MGSAYQSQSRSQGEGSSAIALQPSSSDLDVGGLDAWGNGAVAEQMPAVAGPAAGGGGAGGGAAPWWAGEGEASASRQPTDARQQFDEEIAKPHPDGEVVFRLLLRFSRPELIEVQKDRATWSKVESVCTPQQLALIQERLGVYEGILEDDPAVWSAVQTLRSIVAKDVRDRLNGSLTEVPLEYGKSVVLPGTQPRVVDVTLSEETRSQLGLAGNGAAQVSVWQPDLTVIPIAGRMGFFTIRVSGPRAAQARVLLQHPMTPWDLPWTMADFDVVPFVGPIFDPELVWT